jgi:hypothetical protein
MINAPKILAIALNKRPSLCVQYVYIIQDLEPAVNPWESTANLIIIRASNPFLNAV